MRITANSQEQYPLLGSLVEALDDYVDENDGLKRALVQSCGGRDADLMQALAPGNNPWVTVSDITTGDKRGGFSTDRENTIVVGRDFADRLVAGGDATAYQECAAVLGRGLLHWLARADWTAVDSAPGAAFEKLLAAQAEKLKDPDEQEKPPAADPAKTRTPPRGPEPKEVVHLLGAAILDIAKRHLGQDYRFEPTPDYNNPNWPGPFDCAEYVSYCVYRAYEIPYGVAKDPVKKYNAYSGYWQRDAKRQGTMIPGATP